MSLDYLGHYRSGQLDHGPDHCDHDVSEHGSPWRLNDGSPPPLEQRAQLM